MKTLNRSDLNYKLRKVSQYSLTIASAPKGFGKTTALHAYFDHQPVNTLWFTLFEQNDEEWIWNTILLEIAKTLLIDLHKQTLPTTRMQLDTFLQSINKKLKKPLFIILDDVLVEDAPNIMKMLSMYSYIPNNLVHFVLITTKPLHLLTSYAFSMQTMVLQIEDFVFSKKEIIYLCHLEKLNLSESDLDFLYDHTNGWILAIELLINTYKNTQSLFHHTDIYALIRGIFYDSLDIEVQHGLMKLSVLESFSLAFAFEICESQQTMNTLTKLIQEKHFIHVVDFEKYKFMPFLKEFLSQQLLISSIDITKLYNKIGTIYLEHDIPLKALEIFLKIRDFDQIIAVFNEYKKISFSDIEPQLIKDIFKQLPDTYKNEHPYIYLKWILDCITNFPAIFGPTLLEDFKQRIDNGCIQKNKQHLYGEYYFIQAFLSFNNVYEMMNGFKVAHRYFQGSISKFAYPFMITSFGSCHMLFLYYNKPTELYKTVNYITENIHYFVEITGGIHSGTANLIKAEYFYEIGSITQAELYANIAYNEAMEKNQISSAICCIFLLGRCAYMQHNEKEFNLILSKLHGIYDSLYSPILQSEVDCALGYLYIISNQLDNISDWLKEGDFKKTYTLPEGDMIAYIIHGLYLCRDRNINALRDHISVIREHNRQYPFAIATYFNDLFEIITYCETGKTQGALTLFNKFIATCQQDKIIMFIVECSFAYEHVFTMFAPTTSYENTLLSLFQNHKKMCSDRTQSSKILSPKEFEIFELYAKGMTMKKISEYKRISINTVQTHLKSIYLKLDISTKSEAITYYNRNF